jgi:hypothetical protein
MSSFVVTQSDNGKLFFFFNDRSKSYAGETRGKAKTMGDVSNSVLTCIVLDEHGKAHPQMLTEKDPNKRTAVQPSLSFRMLNGDLVLLGINYRKGSFFLTKSTSRYRLGLFSAKG